MAQYLNSPNVCVLYMKSLLVAITLLVTMPKFQKLVGLLNQKSNPSSPMLSVDVHVVVMLTAQNFTYEQNHPD